MRLTSLCCCFALALSAACSDTSTPPPSSPAATASAPITSVNYRLFHSDGSRASWQELIAAVEAASVTFLGEMHGDPVAHHLEASILRETVDANTVLSLEMFETDVQDVLDEYLAGLITEEHMVSDTRAWDGYDTAYRPLVELAREHGVPVIAANPPRRYVNLVSREGVSALDTLPASAKQFLPPLPYADSSPAYARKFQRLMEENGQSSGAASSEDPDGDQHNLAAQGLWDAGMAYSIARVLEHNPGVRVLHVNGSFHSAEGLGIPEHLARYRPDASMLVITMIPDSRFPRFTTTTMRGLGDFIIVTDPNLQPDPDEQDSSDSK